MARYIKFVGGPRNGQVDRVDEEDERHGLPAPNHKLGMKEYEYVATGQIVEAKGTLYGHAEVFRYRNSFTRTQGIVAMTEPNPNESAQQLAIAVGALTISLIDKGTITQEEYDRAYAQATVIVDQEFARKRDSQGG